MKTFQLQSSMLITNDTVVSIPNSYHNKAFPYWISNTTGATIKKIKIMIGYTQIGPQGGSINFKLYKNVPDLVHTHSLPMVNKVNGLDKEFIETNWELLTEMDYSASDIDAHYATDFKIIDIDIENSAYIIGTADVVGEIQASNIFVWVEYENKTI